MAQETIESRTQSTRPLWVSLLSGPIVYSLHFLLVYFLVEAACRADWLRFELLGLNGISVWVLVLTVIAALVTLYSGWRAWRRWRESKEHEPERLEGYAGLMSFSGVWLNGIFTGLILLTGLPALWLVVCDWT
jgi:hypothetical protein